MARVFNENLHDLPLADPLEWELWERLVEVLEPYGLEEHNRPLFFATDGRGSYDAPTLEEFRAEVERQEETPGTIRLTFSVQNYYVNAYASNFIGSGGQVQSQDEAFVNHVATRIRDLFQLFAKEPPVQTIRAESYEEASIRAAEEYATELENGPQYVNVVTDVLPARSPWDRRRAKLRAFFYDQWVIGIGTALVAAGLIALIVWLTR